MQNWKYARMIARWSDRDDDRNFYIQYYELDGSRKETPAKVLKGKREVLPPDAECWNWFDRKIAELGLEGWEMVNGPGSQITPSLHGGAYTYCWILWFKRPSLL